MKQLKCEMCGSTELVKQDGVFVCQSCGCKYSVEEAKKLMVEIDNSKKMSNLYERAKKSLEINDIEHVEEYFKQILDENPNDWEAYFYTYLYAQTSITNGEAGDVAMKLGKTISEAYDMAAETDDSDEKSRRFKLISEKTADRLANIAAAGKSMLSPYEGGNILTAAGKVNCDLYQNLRPTAQNTVIGSLIGIDLLVAKVEETLKDGKIDAETRRECLKTLLHTKFDIANITYSPSAGMTEKMIKDEAIKEYGEKLKEVDPDFEIPVLEDKKASSGGCYVATAVYGSYDCPQVWTLRRYRDYTLAETWYGRAFIYVYYAISPTIVKWFGNTDWFKKMWRGTLDHMVENLNAKGVKNTPYADRRW